MENIIFATVLYIAVVSGLCWLTTPITRDAEAQNGADAEMQENANLPHHPITPSPHRPISPSPRRPVASSLSLNDLKSAFAVEPEPDTEVAQEEIAAPTNTNITIEDIDIKDIETLKLRPARKIASQLGIQQKVGGKDQPLSWLRAQIKKRLQEEPQTTAPIITEVLSVA